MTRGSLRGSPCRRGPEPIAPVRIVHSLTTPVAMTAISSPSDTGLLRSWRDGCDVDDNLLVREVNLHRKRDGSPFVRLTLADRWGWVAGVCWAPPQQEPVEPGDVMHVRGAFSVHPRYGRQVTVREIHRPSDD